MPSDPHRIDRWRQLAAEALAVAKELTDPKARRIMLAIAAGYQNLVQRTEERRAPAPAE